MGEVNVELKYEIGDYILKNKACYAETGRHYEKYSAWVINQLKYLKKIDPEFHAKVTKVALEAAAKVVQEAARIDDSKYKMYVDYVIENECSVQEAAIRFNISTYTIRNAIFYFETRDVEYFQKAREITLKAGKCKMKKGSAKGVATKRGLLITGEHQENSCSTENKPDDAELFKLKIKALKDALQDGKKVMYDDGETKLALKAKKVYPNYFISQGGRCCYYQYCRAVIKEGA